MSNETLTIKLSTCTSNWMLADCRYNVLLGIPSHVANNPAVDYVIRVVQARDEDILVDQKSPLVVNRRVTVTSVRLK